MDSSSIRRVLEESGLKSEAPIVIKPKPVTDDRVFGAEAINRRCDELRAAGKRPILGTPGKGYRRACLPEPPPPIPERAGSKAAERRLKQMAKLQAKQKGDA